MKYNMMLKSILAEYTTVVSLFTYCHYSSPLLCVGFWLPGWGSHPFFLTPWSHCSPSLPGEEDRFWRACLGHYTSYLHITHSPGLLCSTWFHAWVNKCAAANGAHEAVTNALLQTECDATVFIHWEDVCQAVLMLEISLRILSSLHCVCCKAQSCPHWSQYRSMVLCYFENTGISSVSL